MKKLLFIVALCFAFGISFSQVQKGDRALGFQGTLSTQTGSDQSNLSATVFLSWESYLSNTISLGIGPILSITENGGTSRNSLGMNVFLNINFLTSSGKAIPYIGLLGNYLTASTTFDDPIPGFPASSTTDIAGVGGKAGVKIFASERINFDINLNYTQTLFTSIDGTELDAIEGGQLQLFAGIGVILAKKGN